MTKLSIYENTITNTFVIGDMYDEMIAKLIGMNVDDYRKIMIEKFNAYLAYEDSVGRKEVTFNNFEDANAALNFINSHELI